MSDPGRSPARSAAPSPAGEPATPGSPVAALPASLRFEDALEQLEAIVARLEGGDLALEESLARFEDGVRLSRHLAEQLEGAERRVDELLREGGGLVVRPFDAGADEDEAP